MVVHLVEQAGERQNLALADQLLVEVGVEQLDFFAQGAGHFGLLHALGVGQFLLAKLQNLAVIEARGSTLTSSIAPSTSQRILGRRRNYGFEAFEVHGRVDPILLFYDLESAGQKGGNGALLRSR